MISESEIEKKVCQYAREKGFLVYKFISPGHFGVPDRLFLPPFGYSAFFIEFKRKDGRLGTHQEREIKAIMSQGHPVFIIRSVEEGIRLINEMIQEMREDDAGIQPEALDA